MSMHTTGCSELGCIIKGNDMDYFVKKYVRFNPSEFEEFNLEVAKDCELAEENVWEWLDTNDAFKYSRDADKEGGEEFYARVMRDDPYYPELYFSPIAEEFEYRSEEPDLIFVQANFECYTRGVLRGDFYQ